MTDRKRLLREYKENPPAMGVYRMRNSVTGRSLLGTSMNLPGILNRQRFQLEMGSHPNKGLDRDLKDHGAHSFSIEVLDTLERCDEPGYDPAEDLRELLEMWSQRLRDAGEELYER